MSNYNYADGAIHNDHHKEMTINVSGKTDIAALMKAFMADDAEEAEVVSADDTTDNRVLPEVLCTPDAEALCNKLVGAGIVDEKWQPLSLSNAEKGTLVEYIANKLNIRNKWKLLSGYQDRAEQFPVPNWILLESLREGLLQRRFASVPVAFSVP